MGIARSTFYREPPGRFDDAELLAAITAICDAYGWRRVWAALRRRGPALTDPGLLFEACHQAIGDHERIRGKSLFDARTFLYGLVRTYAMQSE